MLTLHLALVFRENAGGGPVADEDGGSFPLPRGSEYSFMRRRPAERAPNVPGPTHGGEQVCSKSWIWARFPRIRYSRDRSSYKLLPILPFFSSIHFRIGDVAFSVLRPGHTTVKVGPNLQETEKVHSSS